eukprot:843293_1
MLANMATFQVHTSDQGENEDEDTFNFDKWLSNNKLNSIKDLLIKHNLTTKATITMGSNEFRNLMSDPQLLIKAQTTNDLIPTVLSAIQKLTQNNSKSKSKVIVITEQE